MFVPLPDLDATETSGSNSTDSEAVMQYLDTIYKQVSQQAVVAAMNIGGS